MTKFPDQPFDPGPQAPDFTGASDPFALFETWMAEAEKSEPVDPNAMALATVDGAGLPNVRMVLLKAYGPDGFVFYTNSESAKGTELAPTSRPLSCSIGRACTARCAYAGRSRW